MPIAAELTIRMGQSPMSDVVLLGRTVEEYCRYFQLSDIELGHGTTLDLGAGVSSFSAEARRLRNDVDLSPRVADAMAYAQFGGAMPERHVKLFKNGRNQAVRIPREFELPGNEALMRKEGTRLIIEPAPPKSLLAVLRALSPLDDDFPAFRDLPPDPVDL